MSVYTVFCCGGVGFEASHGCGSAVRCFPGNNDWQVAETVSDINCGEEHATAAGNLTFVLVTNQVFSAAVVSGCPGVSGGPLCVQYTNGTYYPAGVFLGGSDQTIVRAIDGDVADLIDRADVAANTGNNNTGGGVLTITPGQGGSGLFASLDVTLGPPAALAAGGGWRVQGDSFYPNYHTTTENLVAFTVGGTKTLEFKQIPGWDLVAQTNITVALGQKTIISALYTQTTSTAPPPSPKLVVSRTFGLGITGATGVTFRLEYRNSLRTGQWLPLRTNTLGPGTNFLLAFPFTNGPAAFYRAVWLL